MHSRIFVVRKRGEPDPEIPADWLAEHPELASYSVDYVRESDLESDLRWLGEYLEGWDGGRILSGRTLRLRRAALEPYFERKRARAQEILSDPEAFRSGSALLGLESLLKPSFLVLCDGEILTLDDFLRHAEGDWEVVASYDYHF